MRGPLHGIPIALKDNIQTTEHAHHRRCAGVRGLIPPYEATLTKNLRDAGAIIIAKTGMTELANWVAGAPTPMPGNYNAVGGYGIIPTIRAATRARPRSTARPALQTGGSSSGIGTAANFWAGNVGTETSGSILSPSNQNMLVGHQAHRRPHQPLRRDSDHSRSGHRGPHGEDRHRCRHHARRARERRARSERSGHQNLHASARPRLYAIPKAGRTQGRAHRHPARVSITTAVTPPGESSAARRTQCRSGESRWTMRSRC